MEEEQRYEWHLPTPKEVVEELNRYVIGQDDAKKTLALAVINHYKRLIFSRTFGNLDCNEMDELFNSTAPELADIELDKSNILLLGNTGTGKTHLIKTIARFLKVPCFVGDCTKFTESGYVGDDVESVLSGLIRESNGNIGLAQWGIVVLDEIDKLSKRRAGTSLTRDVGGEGVQQSLLKIVEGNIVDVPPNGGRKHPEQQCIPLDTTNILFIGLGAFEGLDDMIRSRMVSKKVGFGSSNKQLDEKENALKYLDTEDLIKYGFMSELLGRFPVMTYTNDLSKEDLIAIMNNTKNSVIDQYRKLMACDGVKLKFSDNALDYIAEWTLSHNIGARGLRRTIEKLLFEEMFRTGSDKKKQTLKITKEFAVKKLGPIKKKEETKLGFSA